MLNAITETIGGADPPATKKTANITNYKYSTKKIAKNIKHLKS